MDQNFENLRQFIEKIKNINFFERIFKWKSLKKLFLLSYSEYEKISYHFSCLQEKISELKSNNIIINNDFSNLRGNYNIEHEELVVLRQRNGSLNENISYLNIFKTDLESQIKAKDSDIKRLNIDKITIQQQFNSLKESHETVRDENIKLLTEEEARKRSHGQAIDTLNKLSENVSYERQKEKDDLIQKEINRIKSLKEKWINHQESVKNAIKSICQRNIIQYIDKVPFKLEPDNCIQIASEFIVFDSKCPGTDDLSNFPSYLKDQAEKAKKYAKQDGVCSTVYFVVPTNTLESLDSFIFKHGDHNVVIISYDSLESIILNLKKIEDYEFVDQLSVQERDNIYKIIGKFTHLSKRRIQIDGFFSDLFLELISKSEKELTTEVLDKVIEFEKSEKINPPQEKRAKTIAVSELEKSSKRLKKDVEYKGILTGDIMISTSINEIPLYIEQAN